MAIERARLLQRLLGLDPSLAITLQIGKPRVAVVGWIIGPRSMGLSSRMRALAGRNPLAMLLAPATWHHESMLRADFDTAPSPSPDLIPQIQWFLGVEPSGDWDDATVAALREFQADQGLPPDGLLSDDTRKAIDGLATVDDDGDLEDSEQDEALSFSTPTSVGDGPPLDELRSWCDLNEFVLVDYRDLKKWPRNKTYPPEYGYPRNKSRADPPKSGLLRDWATITTFMLHTTAVGGMEYRRGVGIPCHLYLPKEDNVVLCHEFERLIYHGHAGNRFSVGLEISGVSDWDSPRQIERARALVRYFQAVRRANSPGAECNIMAHRQSHKSRTNDPGMRIWRDVGEWAIEELGFKLSPVVGTGKSVDAWRGNPT